MKTPFYIHTNVLSDSSVVHEIRQTGADQRLASAADVNSAQILVGMLTGALQVWAYLNVNNTVDAPFFTPAASSLDRYIEKSKGTGIHGHLHYPEAAAAIPGASPAPSDFNKRLDGYVERVEKLSQAYIDKLWAKNIANGLKQPRVFISIERGPKYARIVHNEEHNGQTGQRHVHTFVDLTNGNVLKAAGWKAPDKKNPRSNINDADYGISGVTEHGAKYLR